MNDKRVKEAQTLLQEGKLDKSLEIFLDVVEDNPEWPEIFHIIGVIYAKKGDFKKALNYIHQAIELKPTEAAFYNSQGNIYLKQNNIHKALQCYQKAIQFSPKYAFAYNNIGKCFYLKKKLTDAEKAYQNAISLLPTYVDAHYNLGILYADLGKTDDAINNLQKAIQLNENYAPAYGQLAEIYLQIGNNDKAIDNYMNRLQFQPNHANSWNGLGQALIQKNETQKAIKAFEKVVTINSHYSEINHSLANAYLKSGDPDKALNYYLRQITLAPMIESYFNVGVILMNKDRNKEAIEYFEHAEKLDPDYLPIFINLGAIYLKLNNMEMAIKNYKKSLALKPGDSEIEHILAAISQEKTPSAAPKEYLEHLFNQYSSFYDHHLVNYLRYQVPEKLYQLIEQEINIENTQWDILDLGCGTGLCGEHFKKIAKKLVGIDISSQMIEEAKQKKVYDDLKIGNILDVINQYHNFDLILAADVFTYIGELSLLFEKIHDALKPGGYFAFSVEKTNTEPYCLQKTIRYAHSENYLKTLIKQHHFTERQFENAILRKQQKKPIEGYLVLLQRP